MAGPLPIKLKLRRNDISYALTSNNGFFNVLLHGSDDRSRVKALPVAISI